MGSSFFISACCFIMILFLDFFLNTSGGSSSTSSILSFFCLSSFYNFSAFNSEFGFLQFIDNFSVNYSSFDCGLKNTVFYVSYIFWFACSKLPYLCISFLSKCFYMPFSYLSHCIWYFLCLTRHLSYCDSLN